MAFNLLDFSHGHNLLTDERNAVRIVSGDVTVYGDFKDERRIAVPMFPNCQSQLAGCRNRDSQGSLSRASVKGDGAECRLTPGCTCRPNKQRERRADRIMFFRVGPKEIELGLKREQRGAP